MKLSHMINSLKQNKKVSSKIKKDLTYIDLFSGSGGLSLGFDRNNFTLVQAIDHDKNSIETFKFNRKKKENILCSDIQKIKNFKRANFLIGGPPCQGFSNANQQKKIKDERNKLYQLYLNYLDKSQAKYCLMENVMGLKNFYEEISNDFNKIGFKTFYETINTSEFGFPQNRKRLFIFGLKTKNETKFIDFKNFITGNLSKYKKVYSKKYDFNLFDAIGDLPSLKPKNIRNKTNLENNLYGYTVKKYVYKITPYNKLINFNKTNKLLLNHKTKYNNLRDIKIYSLLKPGENSTSNSIKDLMPYKRREKIFKDKFYKLDFKKKCKTVTSHMYYDCHMYIHPNQSRGLTPREAARVQGFPDDYYFCGGTNEWYRQIGNSVSPLISNILALILKDFHEKNN